MCSNTRIFSQERCTGNNVTGNSSNQGWHTSPLKSQIHFLKSLHIPLPNKSKGVGIICRWNLNIKLLYTWTDDQGRIVVAKVHVKHRNIALVSVYAPNGFEGEFFDHLTKTLLDLPDFKLIIGTDFNAVLDPTLDRSGQTATLEQEKTSKALKKLLENLGLVDLWCLFNPNVLDFTHMSLRHKSFLRLDYIF